MAPWPTALVPESPFPLHYKNAPGAKTGRPLIPRSSGGLGRPYEQRVTCVFRYGPIHLLHECMAVLSGTATIRFGAGDTSKDRREKPRGSAWEGGSVELGVEAGEVFVIPAGVAHKTYDARPQAAVQLLTPGSGHEIEAEDPRTA